jgi:hypothetical protein
MAILLAGASSALAGGVDVRIGGFFPRGGGVLWTDDCDLYQFRGCSEVHPDQFAYRSYNGDLKGLFGGIEYNTAIANNLELGVHLDGYGRNVETSYRRYVREDGSEIRQTLKVTMVPVGATLRFVPTGKRGRFAPYVGGGVDAIFYTYKEQGEFIDFFDPSQPILGDSFRSDGVALGVHVVGGLRVYLNHDVALVGEGRYQWGMDEMGDDFAPNESGLVNKIDLSGASFVVGLHVRF